jgi:hypothetical protein
MPPKRRFHVQPRSIDAFAIDVGSAIENVVEDLESEMRLSDLVDLGKSERETKMAGRRFLFHRTAFVPQIASRFVDETQELFVVHSHGNLLPRTPLARQRARRTIAAGEYRRVTGIAQVRVVAEEDS